MSIPRLLADPVNLRYAIRTARALLHPRGSGDLVMALVTHGMGPLLSTRTWQAECDNWWARAMSVVSAHRQGARTEAAGRFLATDCGIDLAVLRVLADAVRRCSDRDLGRVLLALQAGMSETETRDRLRGHYPWPDEPTLHALAALRAGSVVQR